MTTILRLSEIPSTEIEALLDAAFGADRHGRTAYRLREGVGWIPELSFAAVDGSGLIGTVQCWPVALDGTPLTLVGPVAVAPARQRGGIGRLLMEHCLEAADRLGHDALVMIGDPEYYGRFFGFSAAETGAWCLPGPVERHRLLARIARPEGVPRAGRLGPARSFTGTAATA